MRAVCRNRPRSHALRASVPASGAEVLVSPSSWLSSKRVAKTQDERDPSRDPESPVGADRQLAYGLHRGPENGRDLLVLEARSDEAGDLQLPVREAPQRPLPGLARTLCRTAASAIPATASACRRRSETRVSKTELRPCRFRVRTPVICPRNDSSAAAVERTPKGFITSRPSASIRTTGTRLVPPPARGPASHRRGAPSAAHSAVGSGGND